MNAGSHVAMKEISRGICGAFSLTFDDFCVHCKAVDTENGRVYKRWVVTNVLVIRLPKAPPVDVDSSKLHVPHKNFSEIEPLAPILLHTIANEANIVIIRGDVSGADSTSTSGSPSSASISIDPFDYREVAHSYRRLYENSMFIGKVDADPRDWTGVRKVVEFLDYSLRKLLQTCPGFLLSVGNWGVFKWFSLISTASICGRVLPGVSEAAKARLNSLVFIPPPFHFGLNAIEAAYNACFEIAGGLFALLFPNSRVPKRGSTPLRPHLQHLLMSVLHRSWHQVRDDILFEINSRPEARYAEVSSLVYLLDVVIPACTTLYTDCFRSRNFDRWRKALGKFCIVSCFLRCPHYRKLSVIALKQFEYWERECPSFFEWFTEVYWLIDDMFNERFHAPLRSATKNVQDVTQIQSKGTQLFNSFATSLYLKNYFRRKRAPPPVAEKKLKKMVPIRVKYIVSLFTKIMAHDQATIHRAPGKEPMYTLPNLSGCEPILPSRMARAFSTTKPPSVPAHRYVRCDVCCEHVAYDNHAIDAARGRRHKDCKHYDEKDRLPPIDMLPCGHSLCRCRKCRMRCVARHKKIIDEAIKEDEDLLMACYYCYEASRRYVGEHLERAVERIHNAPINTGGDADANGDDGSSSSSSSSDDGGGPAGGYGDDDDDDDDDNDEDKEEDDDDDDDDGEIHANSAFLRPLIELLQSKDANSINATTNNEEEPVASDDDEEEADVAASNEERAFLLAQQRSKERRSSQRNDVEAAIYEPGPKSWGKGYAIKVSEGIASESDAGAAPAAANRRRRASRQSAARTSNKQ